MVLAQPGLDPLDQARGRAGLGVEAEDVALVDGVDRGLLVGVAGKHQAHRFRGRLGDLLQGLDTVHARHAHVAHDHAERLRGLDDPERLFAGLGHRQGELPLQVPAEPGEYVGLVVHQQDLRRHAPPPSWSALDLSSLTISAQCPIRPSNPRLFR